MNNGDQYGGNGLTGSQGAGPYQVMRAVADQYGTLPPFGTGFGPSFGGGWGNWGGQSAPGYSGTSDLTDAQVQSLIYDTLDNDPMVPHNANVDVAVNNGTVTLSGEVRGRQVKRHLGQIAWAAPGVRDVNNEITIRGRQQSGAGGRGAGSGTSGQGGGSTSAPKTGARSTVSKSSTAGKSGAGSKGTGAGKSAPGSAVASEVATTNTPGK